MDSWLVDISRESPRAVHDLLDTEAVDIERLIVIRTLDTECFFVSSSDIV